jgi:hypothetical protein
MSSLPKEKSLRIHKIRGFNIGQKALKRPLGNHLAQGLYQAWFELEPCQAPGGKKLGQRHHSQHSKPKSDHPKDC